MPAFEDGDPMNLYYALQAGSHVEDDLKELVDHLDAAFVETLTGPRSGPVYTTYFFTGKDGKVHPWGHRPPHQASAPGEAPAFDTGDLLRSIKILGERQETQITVTITANINYAIYLEKGTSKMLPRPFMEPTVTREMPAIETIIYDGIVKREEEAIHRL